MDSQHTTILDQLASGIISAEEAASRLRAPDPASGPTASLGAPGLAGRWLHIRVTNLETGRSKVNVNLPLSWVDVGMRIGSTYQPSIAGFDVRNLLEQIKTAADGKLVEVEDVEGGERVEIFVD